MTADTIISVGLLVGLMVLFALTIWLDMRYKGRRKGRFHEQIRQGTCKDVTQGVTWRLQRKDSQ